MHRGEVFAAEPPFALASVGEALAKVARIAPWGIRAGTVVDKQAVGVERLRERYRRIFAVGIHTEGDHGAVKRTRVDNAEKRDLLLPNLYHCGVERLDIAFSFLKRLGTRNWGLGIGHK